MSDDVVLTGVEEEFGRFTKVGDAAPVANLNGLMSKSNSIFWSNSTQCRPPADGANKLGGKSRRIRYGLSGIKNTDQYAGSWTKYSFGADGKVAYAGTIDNNKDEDKGFIIEISIPKSSVEIIDGKVLVNFGYYDALSNAEDSIADTGSNSTANWLTIKGL